MNNNFQVRRGANDNWFVLSQTGARLARFRRQGVAVAYGKALAHRARVSLVVHTHGKDSVRYSRSDLTYSHSI